MEANWPAELDGNAHSATEVRSLLSEKLCVPEEAGKGVDAPEPSSTLSAAESRGSGRSADGSARSSSGMRSAWSHLAKSRRRILDLGRRKLVDRGSGKAGSVLDCVPGGHVLTDGATFDAILEAGLGSVVPWASERDGSEPVKGARARPRSDPFWRSRRAERRGSSPQPASDVHFEALRKEPAKALSLGELLLKDGMVARVTTVCLADLALRLRDLADVPCTSEDGDAAGVGIVDPGFFHAPATRVALDEYASSIFFGQNASGNAHQDELGALHSSAPSNLPPVTMVFTSLEGLSSARSRDAQAAETLLELHSEILRSAKLRFGGYLCQVSDGSRMFAFRTASDGLSFALAAQLALLQYPWPPEVLALDICCEAARHAEGRPSLRGPRVRA